MRTNTFWWRTNLISKYFPFKLHLFIRRLRDLIFSQHELFNRGATAAEVFFFFRANLFLHKIPESMYYSFLKGSNYKTTAHLTINLKFTVEDPHRLITLISHYRRWALQLIPDHLCTTRAWRESPGLSRWRNAQKNIIFHLFPVVYLGWPAWTRYRFRTWAEPFDLTTTEWFCIQNWYSFSRTGKASLNIKQHSVLTRSLFSIF